MLLICPRIVRIRVDGEGEPDSEPSLCRSGRRHQTEAVQPPRTTRSGSQTRGGGTQRAESRANQGRQSDSDTETGDQSSGGAHSVPPTVELFDLRGLKGPRVKRLRYVAEETWFPKWRDERADHRFYTIMQESFYHAYNQMDVPISEHRTLHWNALRIAAGGVSIVTYFERYPGLVALLSERDRYIREWVWVFYATLFVEQDRQYIGFMFQERSWRLD